LKGQRLSWLSQINQWLFEKPTIMAYVAGYSIIYGLAVLALFILVAVDTPTWSHIIAPILYLPLLYFLGVKGWEELKKLLKS